MEIDGLSRCGFSGEKGMLVAMLSRSVLDLRSESAKVRREAVGFFINRDEEPFSFIWTCEHLELSPSAFLKELTSKFEL